MIGALLSQTIMLFKTTSLVYIVGVIEFFRAMQIVNNAVYAPFATYALLAVVYFICRSEEHTSELQSLMRISYAVFCLTKNIYKSSYHQTTLQESLISL